MLFLEISKKNRKFIEINDLFLVCCRRFCAFQLLFSTPPTAFYLDPVGSAPVTR